MCMSNCLFWDADVYNSKKKKFSNEQTKDGVFAAIF